MHWTIWQHKHVSREEPHIQSWHIHGLYRQPFWVRVWLQDAVPILFPHHIIIPYLHSNVRITMVSREDVVWAVPIETCFWYRVQWLWVISGRLTCCWASISCLSVGLQFLVSRGSKVSPLVASKTYQITIETHKMSMVLSSQTLLDRVWLQDVVRTLLATRVNYAHLFLVVGTMASSKDVVRAAPIGWRCGNQIVNTTLLLSWKVNYEDGRWHLLTLHFPAPNVHRGG